ncbi:MAG: helix-turn-helix transcriptional regulator [Betaproteobacteria bacterium]|nr:helix-turn-helix transcriptional regulator [Betaproteobacteria bacterium]
MTTDFGRKVQQLRQLAGMTLFEVAQKMNLSSAFLSAVENGRKRVPDDFVEKLGRALPEARTNADTLESMANQARQQVVVPLPKASRQDADLATALARKFNTLSDDQKRYIRAILDNYNPAAEDK